MEVKEAADLLDNLIGMVEDSHGADYDTALRMGIEALSAQPDPDKLHLQKEQAYMQGWEDARLIDRQAAIDALAREDNKHPFRNMKFSEIAKCIRELPTALPEIISCKDCGYYDPADNDEESDWCHAWGETTEENAFCSYAEEDNDRA